MAHLQVIGAGLVERAGRDAVQALQGAESSVLVTRGWEVRPREVSAVIWEESFEHRRLTGAGEKLGCACGAGGDRALTQTLGVEATRTSGGAVTGSEFPRLPPHHHHREAPGAGAGMAAPTSPPGRQPEPL